MANNSGNAKNPALTKRGRFNANPTVSGHPSCMVSNRSKSDKKASEKAARKVVVYKSKAKGMFYV